MRNVQEKNPLLNANTNNRALTDRVHQDSGDYGHGGLFQEMTPLGDYEEELEGPDGITSNDAKSTSETEKSVAGVSDGDEQETAVESGDYGHGGMFQEMTPLGDIQTNDGINPSDDENQSKQLDTGDETAASSGDYGHGGMFQEMTPLGNADPDVVNPDIDNSPSDVEQSGAGAAAGEKTSGDYGHGGLFQELTPLNDEEEYEEDNVEGLKSDTDVEEGNDYHEEEEPPKKPSIL